MRVERLPLARALGFDGHHDLARYAIGHLMTSNERRLYPALHMDVTVGKGGKIR
jgi:hypothetical protein